MKSGTHLVDLCASVAVGLFFFVSFVCVLVCGCLREWSYNEAGKHYLSCGMPGLAVKGVPGFLVSLLACSFLFFSMSMHTSQASAFEVECVCALHCGENFKTLEVAAWCGAG